MRRLARLIRALCGDRFHPGWRHAGLLGVGIGAIVLLVEGFALRDPFEPAPRDIDASVKRAQTLALSQSNLRHQAIPYRAEYLDPQRWFLPFVKPFVMRTRTGTQAIFPTVAAVVDVPAERVGGMAALRAVSITAVLLSILLTLRLASATSDAIAPLVILFGTPLWYYALGGTSHSLGLLAATAAVYVALDGNRALAAGLLLGVSSTLRDETLALVPGLVLVCAWRWRDVRPLLRLAVGVALPILLVALVDSQLYGRPAAAHLLHAVRGTFFPDTPSGSMVVLESMSWRERVDVVLVYWLDGRNLGHAALVSAAVAAAALVRWRSGTYWGALPALAIVMAGAGEDVLTMMEAPKRLPGLMRLAPFLIFALLPHAEETPDQRQRRWSLLGLAGSFVLVAMMTTNTSGGKALGPRLLLPIWPLLAMVAWQGIRGHALARSPKPAQRVLAGCGVVLLASGLLISSIALVPLFRTVETDALDATRFLAGTPEEVIVMGSPFAVDPVIAVYPSRSVLLAASARDAEELARRLQAGRIRHFLFVRRNDREDLVASFPAYAVEKESVFGRWVVQRWVQQ